MESTAYMVAMSHLSDAQEGIDGLMDTSSVRHAKTDINFAKFLIMKYKNDMAVSIDPDKEYSEFQTKFPNA